MWACSLAHGSCTLVVGPPILRSPIVMYSSHCLRCPSPRRQRRMRSPSLPRTMASSSSKPAPAHKKAPLSASVPAVFRTRQRVEVESVAGPSKGRRPARPLSSTSPPGSQPARRRRRKRLEGSRTAQRTRTTSFRPSSASSAPPSMSSARHS